ncbi:hypothetical protein HPB51_012116 [Rhipicephalus microplus]|uniref:Uncharacterized protein n=1 Tax=Rhipicephalus microplus TaxID=6941 RepID=A0A9J6DV97_RHIMP|nr:hypothetical protein HPB51_012116 [Rhipicephalus microplus]
MFPLSQVWTSPPAQTFPSSYVGRFKKSSYDFKQVTFTPSARSPRAPNHLPIVCESATSKTDRAQKLQILPRGFRFPRRVAATTGCHHLDVPLRTSDRRQQGLYQKITMRLHKMCLLSTTRLRVLLPPLLLLIRPPAPPRFSTYPARMYETLVLPRFSTHPPRMQETWTSNLANHHPRKQWPNEFRSESLTYERSLTLPPTRSRQSPSPRRRSPSPHQLGN